MHAAVREALQDFLQHGTLLTVTIVLNAVQN